MPLCDVLDPLFCARHDPKLEFCELIIPTVDSVRYTYLLNLLVTGDKHVLMTGTEAYNKAIYMVELKHYQAIVPAVI